jgi:hypothetical protein
VDTFSFAGTSLTGLDTGVGGGTRDRIADFSGDIIRLVEIDANLDVAGDQAFTFIGTGAFTAAGQIRVFDDGFGNAIVEGNMNANLAADFQIELNLVTASSLQANNFLL